MHVIQLEALFFSGLEENVANVKHILCEVVLLWAGMTPKAKDLSKDVSFYLDEYKWTNN